MRLLLDTHSFLWFIRGDENISPKTRSLIADLGNEVWLSVASLWEIAIKTSIGSLTLSEPYQQLIPNQLNLHRIQILHISLDDLSNVAELPFFHRDPFDRLIIAQALTRNIPIVGNDARFKQYPVQIIW